MIARFPDGSCHAVGSFRYSPVYRALSTRMNMKNAVSNKRTVKKEDQKLRVAAKVYPFIRYQYSLLVNDSCQVALVQCS